MYPSATVLADSTNAYTGDRLVTMMVTMHRFVLAEFNTHRVFSRNSASSRAIPVLTQLDNARHKPAIPLALPHEKPGMSGGNELQIGWRDDALALLERIRTYTINQIEQYVKEHPNDGQRLHKSVLNRPLEWMQWHTVVVTSTEWENFFALRCHPAAQPEIRAAAELMQKALYESESVVLSEGEWHMPFTNDVGGIAPVGLPMEISKTEFMLKVSAARCAWVSTMKHGKEATWGDVQNIYETLTAGLHSGEPIHASPFEHQATPCDSNVGVPGNFTGWWQLRHMIERGVEPWVPINETQRVFSPGWERMADYPNGGEPKQIVAGPGSPIHNLITKLGGPTRAGRAGDTQPLPVASEHPIAHEMVKADLDARLAIGIERYGQPLQPFNGRDSLKDAYEEVLDLAVYLRNAIYENDNSNGIDA